MRSYFFSFLLSLVFSFIHLEALAVDQDADITAEIRAALSMTKVSDLHFGVGIQGDGPKVISPGVSENAHNASFDVFGRANAFFSVTLPESVFISTADGSGALKRIAVSKFRSYPSRQGFLGESGKKRLFVGATRGRVHQKQVTGSYTGVFTVEVVYH